MACYHLYGDADGESHLVPLDLPARESNFGKIRGFSSVPATTTGMGQFVERKPDAGMHEAPRRQFLLVLGGELEIVTSLGERTRLRAGDLMLADDVGSKGHLSLDVGEEPLMLMSVGIAGEWQGPQR